MATLLVPLAAGVSAGFTFKYIALAALGAYIDSTVIFPTLFPTDDTEGPRIDDLEIARWSEGTPIPRVFGSSARVPGQVIYQSPIREVREEEEVGGKGGGSSTYVTYKYYANVSVAFCEGPVSRIKKIMADGKTIWNAEPNISYEPTTTSATVTSTTSGSDQNGNPKYHHRWKVTVSGSLAEKEEAARCVVGKNVTVTRSGTTKTGELLSRDVDFLNGGVVTLTIKAEWDTTSSTSSYPTWGSGSCRIFQVRPTHNPRHFGTISFNTGEAEQEPSYNQEAAHGQGEVPAYRGIAYVDFGNLFLTEWGNRVPSISAVIEEDTGRTLREAFDKILTEAEIDPGEYDVSGVPDTQLLGYKIGGPQETVRSLQPLLLKGDLLTQQRNGVLTFFERKNARVVDIETKDLAAGRRSKSPIEVEEAPTSRIPDEVNVDFLDNNKDYTTGSVRHRRNNNISTELVSYSIPVVMDSGEAREIATRMLWHQWNNRLTVRFTIPAVEYAGKLLEGDIARFTALGEEWNVLVLKIDRGDNLLMEVEAVMENPSVQGGVSVSEDILFRSNGGDRDAQFRGGTPQDYPPALHFTAFETAPLREKDSRIPGFYFTATSHDPSLGFNIAALYESLDGETYNRVQEVQGAATVGQVTGWTGVDAIHGQFDLVNELTVEFTSGTPQSVSESRLLNGANRAYFDGEIIGFQTATLVSGTTYKLTKLLRGLRGTDSLVNSHTAPGARLEFVQVDRPGIHFHEVTPAAIGRTRYYKLVPNGANPEEAIPYTYTITGATVKPLAPVHFKKTLDGSNNATVTWTNRTRSLAGLFGSHPNAEPTIGYRTSIISGGTAVRSLSSELTTATYTAADATSDGLTPGDPLDVTIAQTSEYHGFGAVSPTTTI